MNTVKQNIYIVGCFGQKVPREYHNTFSSYFNTYIPNPTSFNYIYIDSKKVKLTTFVDSDIIILGGAEVLKTQFLNEITAIFIDKPNTILAVSDTISYLDSNVDINTNKLRGIDYIFVKTQQDLDFFKQHLNPNKIFYVPDLSFFKLNLHPTLTKHCWVTKTLDNTSTHNSINKLKINNSSGLFNMNYIDQNDYSDAHRSGWQFVYEHLKDLQDDNSNLYLDLYVDRTFHWNKDTNKQQGLIPYTKNWIGFIHHTFDTSFSEYNNFNLLDNLDFITSLQHCKALFVLSNTLRLQLLDQLSSKNISVQVFNLVHPTETNVPTFDYAKFLANNDKKLIQVGGWLRNTFSFYYLSIPKTYNFAVAQSYCDIIQHKILTCNMRKVGLKGFSMNNYYPATDLPDKLTNFLSQLEINSLSIQPSQNVSQNISQNISQNASQNASQNSNLHNNWYKHFEQYTKSICDDVDIMQKVNDDDYDTLLSENIVFINLVDASAVNTLVECIVRNTPIIVNKHPAVVEILGPDYPLYFDSTDNYFDMSTQINSLFTDTHCFKNASQCLRGIDKTPFQIDTFIQQFTDYIHQINSN